MKIQDTYGWTGGKYRQLVAQIINRNTITIANAVGNIAEDQINKFNKKITNKNKRFILPDLGGILPTKSNKIVLRKSAEKGKILSNTIKDQLEQDLREVLTTITPKTQEQRFIRRRGKLAGTMNVALQNIFEEKIKQTFENYTKNDPLLGIPSNIHTIAVTEMRSVTNEIKHAYLAKFKEENSDVTIYKRWIQNKHLSKVPRANHSIADDLAPIPYEEKFVFPSIKGGTISMSHPHDPTAPPEETIGCHCEAEYIISRNMNQFKVKKSYNLVEKEKAPLFTESKRKDGYYKKIKQTGRPSDWIKVRNLDGSPVEGLKEEDLPKPIHEDKELEEVTKIVNELWYGDYDTKDMIKALKKTIKDPENIKDRHHLSSLIDKHRDKVLQLMGMKREDVWEFDNLVSNWVGSSGDDGALALQYMINKVTNRFIGDGTFKHKGELQEAKDYLIDHNFSDKHGNLTEKGAELVKAIKFQHNYSSAMHKIFFPDKKNIKLYRGMSTKSSGVFDKKSEYNVEEGFKGKNTTFFRSRPMSSWSIIEKKGKMFGSGYGQFTAVMVHDFNSIFTSYLTHPIIMSSHDERELVVMGSLFQISRSNVLADPKAAQMPELTIQDIMTRNPVLRKQIITGLGKVIEEDKEKEIDQWIAMRGQNPDDLNLSKKVDLLVNKLTFGDIKKLLKTGKMLKTNISDVPKHEIMKELGGSTKAVLVKLNDTGERKVFKKGKSNDHIKNEYYANKLYEAAGVKVAPASLHMSDNGQLIQSTDYIEDSVSLKSLLDDKNSESSRELLKKVRNELKKGFVADCVLGNWDVIGLEYDNIVVNYKDGIPYRIDNGGAMKYRAQGKEKGDAFGVGVKEIDTMRDHKLNPSAAQIYGDLTDAEIKEQIVELTKNRNKLYAVVEDDPKLKELLKNRIQYLVGKYVF